MRETFFTDAYSDPPPTHRGRLTEELRRLKMMLWADGGSDADLEQRNAAAEAELTAHDARGGAR
jgi:hypothetical protein